MAYNQPVTQIKNNTSVVSIVIVVIVLIVSVFLGGAGIAGYVVYNNREHETLQSFNSVLADQAAIALANALWNFEETQTIEIVKSFMKDKRVYAIVVQSADSGKTTLCMTRDSRWIPVRTDTVTIVNRLLLQARDIFYSGKMVGKVQVFITPVFLDTYLAKIRFVIILFIFIVAVLLTIALYMMLWRIVLNPVKLLKKYAFEVNNTPEENNSVLPRHFNGELESLRSSIMEMVLLLKSRYRELQDQAKILIESEAFRKRVFDSSRVPIVIMDALTLQYVDCNDAAVAIYHFPKREDLLGKSPLDFSTATQYDGTSSSEKAGSLISKAINDGSVVFEWRHQRPDGEIWDAEVHLMSFESNNKKLLQFTLQDITKRKQFEEELKKSKANLSALIESTNDLIWSVDMKWRLQTFNQPLAKHFEKNYGTKATIGAYSEDFLPPDRAALWPPLYKRVLSDGPFRMEYSLTDGKVLELSFNPVLHNDTTIGISVFAKDITEQKLAIEKDRLQKEQLQQADKMASLGILVSGVAHEINNPNNFIMLNTPLLKDVWQQAEPILDNYYEKNGEFELGGIPYSEMKTTIPVLFQGIEDGSQRIKRIVEDLKNFARKDICSYENIVDVGQVIKEAISLLTSLINKKTNRFEFIVPQNQVCIKGNKQKLEQVVINLIHNACDALESKDQAVTVRLDVHDSECIISVADGGKGIPAPDLSHLMEPFFTSKRDSGGTGLGLSVSAGIIEEHNGKILFESEVGKGTIVRVVLPVSFAKAVS